MRKSRDILMMAVVIVVAFAGLAPAQVAATVTLDENGNGVFEAGMPNSQQMAAYMGPDVGPGGLTSALNYTSPATITTIGDVLVSEPSPGSGVSDILRFNPNGNIVFYSDIGDNDLADVGLPTQYYSNLVNVTEVGVEGYNWFDYTPLQGQPGYYPGLALTYHVISDTPEPATLSLLALGAFAMIRRRR